MKQTTKDMTSGNPTSLILRFAIPLMIGNIGQQLYTAVDAIIVGQGVGINALAALGAADWIYWMFLWSMTSMTQGFAILLSQRFGARDQNGLRRAYTMSIYLSFITGAVFTVIGLMIGGPLLQLLNTPDHIYNMSLSYLHTLLLGNLIVIAYNMASSILRALGNGKTPLMAMLMAASLNIALDLLFVLVFGWGIIGAAIATLIAQLMAFSFCAFWISRIDILKTTRTDWAPDASVIRRLCRLGLPLALQNIFIATGGMILQSVVNGFGVIFVAGFTATNKLYGLLESSALSFGYSMTTYVGQNLGAGNIKRIEDGVRSVLKLSVGIAIAISAIMLILGRQILSLFVSSGEETAAQVTAIAYEYLQILSILLIILYLLHAYRSSLQGLGNTIAPLISGILEFIMRVSAAMILPGIIGETGIFLAEPAAWTGAAVSLIILYYREIRLVKRRFSKTS